MGTEVIMEYRTKASPGLLILICSLSNVLCSCPLKCSCSSRYRNVDCSDRNLTVLPHGLQDNITNLNLSHNYIANLDDQLTLFTNLRSLDLSHNVLRNLPSHLPKSLWEVYAANNNIKVLHKLDTAYQWNLKVLDVSRNKIQRTVLINNTLSSLRLLNLSSNRLWTVPTNMPYNIQTIDLSNNSLMQIIPDTLVRMPDLQKLYLHNNRFTYIPDDAFDQLKNLQEMTLYNNPWACKAQNIMYLLRWVSKTKNSVIGYPCVNETSQHGTVSMQPLPEHSAEIIDDIPILRTTILPFLEAQDTKLYKHIPFSEASTQAPLNTTGILLASTNYSLFIDEDGGSADEYAHFKPGSFGAKDIPFLSSNEIEDTEIFTPTIIINEDKPEKAPELLQPSTAVYVVLTATTIKQKDHATSSAHKDKCLVSCFLIALLVLRTV
ncbi:oligodendrocyte-myelin glycoprotein [Discoglossus pictus]